MLNTLYAKRVPPKDIGNQTLPPAYPSQYDVALFDVFGNQVGLYPWYYKSKPDRRYKYVMHNCQRYNLKWDIADHPLARM